MSDEITNMKEEVAQARYTPSTSCLECVFAVWDVNEENQTAKQIGCEFNRLDKFRDLGYGLEEKTIEREGREYKHYEINGRICNRAVRIQAMGGIPEDRWVDTVVEFTKAKIAFIIYADETNTPEDIFYSLDILLRENQDQPPKEITVWIDTKNISRQIISEYFKSKNLNCKWNVSQIMDTEPLGFGDSVDEAVKKVKTTYYCPIRAGEITPVNFVENVDNIINEKLKDFLLLVDDTDRPLLFLTNMHKPLGGNYEIPMDEKIRQICKDKGLEAKILNYYEA